MTDLRSLDHALSVIDYIKSLPEESIERRTFNIVVIVVEGRCAWSVVVCFEYDAYMEKVSDVAEHGDFKAERIFEGRVAQHVLQ